MYQKIGFIQLAIGIAIDDNIILTLGSTIKELEKSGKFTIQNLSVPINAPPNVPRFVLNSKEYVINISLDRLDFYFSIPDHMAQHPITTIKYISKLIEEINQIFLSSIVYKWCGIVMKVNYPYKDNQDSKLTNIFDSITSIDRNNDDVVSLTFNFGVKKGWYFKTIGIAEYQSHVLLGEQMKNQQIHLDDENLSERGIEITLDYNNKPNVKNNSFIIDIMKLLNLTIPDINNLPKNTNLLEILT